MPGLLRAFVTDADETLSRAVAADARLVTTPADSAFGQHGGHLHRLRVLRHPQPRGLNSVAARSPPA